MDADWEVLLAIVGTGVALAALILSQMAAHRRELGVLRNELGELRREVNSLGNRVARLEGAIDLIRMGMQLPQPTEETETA